MHNKTFRGGPVALTTTVATDLLSPPGATGGVNAGPCVQYIILRHISVINKTATAAWFAMYLSGASAATMAGTEIIGQIYVPPWDRHDWNGELRLNHGEYIVGGAGASNALVVTFEGEIGVSEVLSTELET